MTVDLPKRADFPEPDDEDVEPWTIEEIEIRSRTVNRRLMRINKEQIRNNDEWVEAKAAYRKTVQDRMVEIYREEPDQPKWAIEAKAEAEATDLAAVAFAWERIVRGNNDEAHNLRSVQSTMQTIYNRLCQQAGHFKGER